MTENIVSHWRHIFSSNVFKRCFADASWNSKHRPARHGYNAYAKDKPYSVLEPSFNFHCPGSRFGGGSGMLMASTMTAALSAFETLPADSNTAWAAASEDRVSRSTFRAVVRTVCSCSASHTPSVARTTNSMLSFTATIVTSGLEIRPLILPPLLLSMSPNARETWGCIMTPYKYPYP